VGAAHKHCVSGQRGVSTTLSAPSIWADRAAAQQVGKCGKLQKCCASQGSGGKRVRRLTVLIGTITESTPLARILFLTCATPAPPTASALVHECMLYRTVAQGLPPCAAAPKMPLHSIDRSKPGAAHQLLVDVGHQVDLALDAQEVLGRSRVEVGRESAAVLRLPCQLVRGRPHAV
jgi:hypothetical protein